MMVEELLDLLKTTLTLAAVSLIGCGLLASFMLPFPFCYLALIAQVAFYFNLWRIEMDRRSRLGTVHDRLREIPLSKQEAAMQHYIEQAIKELKKTKPLT